MDLKRGIQSAVVGLSKMLVSRSKDVADSSKINSGRNYLSANGDRSARIAEAMEKVGKAITVEEAKGPRI
jgi:hypothetical protein